MSCKTHNSRRRPIFYFFLFVSHFQTQVDQPTLPLGQLMWCLHCGVMVGHLLLQHYGGKGKKLCFSPLDVWQNSQKTFPLGFCFWVEKGEICLIIKLENVHSAICKRQYRVRGNSMQTGKIQHYQYLYQ